MFCPQCGTAHTPGGRFCGNCGLLLPFGAIASASPDAGAARADSAAFATSGASRRTSTISAPSLTLAVVACVVAFGVVFVVASALVRDLTGDPMERSVSAQASNANTSQGAMGALLSGGRRTQPTDPTDPSEANRRR
jgi:hypothetical protein